MRDVTDIKTIADAAVAGVEQARAALLKERGRLLGELHAIDEQLERLEPPTARTRKGGIVAAVEDGVGRMGVPINVRDVIYVIYVVGKYYGFTVSQMVGGDRHTSVTRARHVAAYLARDLTKVSYPELGRAFGNRDHTTIIAAVTKIRDDVKADQQLAVELAELRAVFVHDDGGAPPDDGDRSGSGSNGSI